MVHANIPLKIRYKFCAEAFKVATLLDGFSIVAIDGKSQSRFEHYAGCKPPFAQFLRIWGKAATIKVKNFATTKVEDRGVHCMFVGHTGDCYCMWNPKTQGVMETRDCIGLKRFYFPKPVVPYDVSIAPYDDESLPNSVRESIGTVETVTDVEVGESTPFVASTDEPVVVVEPDAVVVNAQNNDDVASLAEVLADPDEVTWMRVTRAGRSVKTPDWFADFAMVGQVNFYDVLAKDEDDDEDVAWSEPVSAVDFSTPVSCKASSSKKRWRILPRARYLLRVLLPNITR
jgi:hypothetical protein